MEQATEAEFESIVLWLPWPPTVNSSWKPIRGAIYLSKPGRIYREQAEQAIIEQHSGIETLSQRLFVEVHLFPPTKRSFDLDNRMKSLLDAITHAEVWTDDSLIDQLIIARGETGGEGQARVEISPAGPIIPLKYARQSTIAP